MGTAKGVRSWMIQRPVAPFHSLAVTVNCAAIAELVLFFHFFFSSRRRHTRSDRDWSSDVCSSDLKVCFGAVFVEGIVIFGLFPFIALLLLAAGEPRASIAGAVIAGFSLGGVIYALFEIGRASCRERV